MGERKELCERVVVQTMTYGGAHLGRGWITYTSLGLPHLFFLRKMYEVNELNIWRKQEARRRAGVKKKIVIEWIRSFFKRFRHVERMHEEQFEQKGLPV